MYVRTLKPSRPLCNAAMATGSEYSVQQLDLGEEGGKEQTPLATHMDGVLFPIGIYIRVVSNACSS